jgi:hypothetical protein
MQLIDQALRSELEARNSLSTSPPPPQVHVRKVQLVIPYKGGHRSEQNSRTGSPTAMSMSEDSGDERGGSEDSAGDQRMNEPSRSGRGESEFDARQGGRSLPIPMRRPPLPTFGSSNSLSSMMGGSPGALPRGTPPSGARGRGTPVPRPTFGSFTSLVDMDDAMEEARLGALRKGVTCGHEITVATGDRQGLLKYMTSALSDFQLELNIRVSGDHILAVFQCEMLSCYHLDFSERAFLTCGCWGYSNTSRLLRRSCRFEILCQRKRQ